MVCISILILLAGIFPFLANFGVIPKFIPTSGTGYYILIIVIGLIGLIYAFINVTMIGLAKIVTICLTLMTVMGGILPFISNFLPINLPTSGPAYSGLIILIGLIGLVYGLISIG